MIVTREEAKGCKKMYKGEAMTNDFAALSAAENPGSYHGNHLGSKNDAVLGRAVPKTRR